MSLPFADGPLVVRGGPVEVPADGIAWIGANVGLRNLTVERGLPANRSTVGATFYLFLADGRLQATNADAEDAARFGPAADQIRLPRQAYALAAGAAGAPLPGFLDAVLPGLREELRVAPAGAILVHVVEQHPLRDVLGVLYLTLQVDG